MTSENYAKKYFSKHSKGCQFRDGAIKPDNLRL